MNNETDIYNTCGFRILSAIRKIIRAVGIHSRKLNSEFHITTPQMICIYELMRNDGITLSQLANAVNISASTVNGIVDRLELKGLLIRQRSLADRRKVLLKLTEAGRQLTRRAPSLLQDKLAEALEKLPEHEQVTIAMSLERIVGLMEAQHIESPPDVYHNEEIHGLDAELLHTPPPPTGFSGDTPPN